MPSASPAWAQEDPPPEEGENDPSTPWDVGPVSPDGLAAGALVVSLAAGAVAGRAITGRG